MLESVKVFSFRCVLKFFSWLPLAWCQRLGGWLGRAMYRLNTREAKVTRKNLELCLPELTPNELELAVQGSLQETGKVIMEMGHAWAGPIKNNLAFFVGEQGGEELDQAIAANQGVIIVAPHLGNWEMLNFYLTNKKPFKVLYQPPESEAVEKLIIDVRNRTGTEIFPTNAKGVAALMKALRKGEVVAILPDQNPPEESGVFVPFFGLPALTMTLVSKLAQKTGAPVITLVAERLPNGQGFVAHADKVDQAIYSDDLTQSVQALSESVETAVRKQPDQYQWEYKRFKRNPDGSKTGYYKGM